MEAADHEKIRSLISDAEMVLIGIGEEFQEAGDESKDERTVNSLDALSSLLKGKTYFVLSQNQDQLIFRSKLLPFFIAEPFGPKEREECGEERWNTYMRWLAGTLGHKLCIMELGVGFSSPQLIRWPFEKTLQLNLKSTFVRVHHVFPQLPRELSESGRAYSVKEDAVSWLLALSDRSES